MATVNLSDITTKDVDGDGVFDELMATINLHLDKQYSNHRIRGAEYASVYLGSINAALSQSIAFTLGKQQADKEAELLIVQAEEARLTGQRQREEIDSRVVLINAQVQEQINATRRADVTLSDQLATSISERVALQKANDLNDVQVAEVVDSTSRANVQLLDTLVTTDAQRTQIASEISLLAAQVIEQAAATIRLDSTAVKDNLLRAAQVDKSNSERDLLNNKTLSEAEQTVLITKQQELYTAQADGFARDAELKLVKVLSDMWQIARGTNEIWPEVIGAADVTSIFERAFVNAGLQ